MKKLTALILFLLFAMTACSSNQAEWDARIEDRLQATPAQQKQVKDGLQELNLEVDCDGFVFEIPQTLGNQRILYVPLTITFPEKIDLHDYVTIDEYGSSSTYISLSLAGLYQGDIPYETVKEQKPKTFSGAYLGRVLNQGVMLTTYDLEEGDLEANRMHFLLVLKGGSTDFDEEEYVTLIIKSLIYSHGEEEEILGGPFAVTWAPTNQGTLYDFSFDWEREEKALTGQVTLSAFHLRLEHICANYDYGRLTENVMLLWKDGTETVPTGQRSGGGGGAGSYSNASWTFREIIDPEQIQSIKIGNVHIDLY